ncbi:hypothetical protein [Halomonas sp. SpR8]|uniref:hypothetical protein n=1 Tax=Halomonas sp. SpR8 TaxID=3050463 RepID=UPI0027E3F447|nr:hypothetical protein [Halomonas sp. SpR8]MDQ7727283.1 hypothetical protein [Halomonas sp. SpR8]
MSQPSSGFLVHIGPLRQESQAVLKHAELPALAVTPYSSAPDVASLPEVSHISAILTPKAGKASYYVYNLKVFNSIAPATELKTLYPGLNETQKQTVETQTLAQVLNTHAPLGTDITQLVLEQPEQALSLLAAWQTEGLLESLETLWVRTSPISLYEEMPTQAELAAWCEQQGFQPSENQHGLPEAEDPELVLASFKRSPLYPRLKAERETIAQQLAEQQDVNKREAEKNKQAQQQVKALQRKVDELTQQRDELKQEQDSQAKVHKALEAKLEETHGWFMACKEQAEKQKDKLDTLQGEHDNFKQAQAELQQSLQQTEEERDKYKQYFTNRKKQHEASEAKRAEQDQTIQRLVEQLAAQQQSSTASQECFEHMEQKLEQLFGEHRGYLQQTSNALGQHVTRTAKEQREHLALQHYLEHGQRSFSEALPPAFAMALIERLRVQRFDLIITFGTSDITQLLAQALMAPPSTNLRIADSNDQQSTEREYTITPAQSDLPQRIISVHHKKSRVDTLKKQLYVQGHHHAVETIHAPWVEASMPKGAEPKGLGLFYACDTLLGRVRQFLDTESSLLIVIGQDLAKAKHSRASALPMLLQQLAALPFEIVVENDSYSHEAALSDSWRSMLDSHQREWQTIDMPSSFCLQITG